MLYSLQMEEQFTCLANYSYQSRDYSVLTNDTWNYALIIGDVNNIDGSVVFNQFELQPKALIFFFCTSNTHFFLFRIFGEI